MKKRPKSPRAELAAERLARYVDAAPEHQHQTRDAWLGIATAGEVRRAWRRWMGKLPGWAVAR